MALLQDKVQTLLVIKVMSVGVSPMKEALIRRIDKTLAKTFKLGFDPTNTGINCAFLCFLEVPLVEKIHRRTLDSSFTTSFDRLL